MYLLTKSKIKYSLILVFIFLSLLLIFIKGRSASVSKAKELLENWKIKETISFIESNSFDDAVQNEVLSIYTNALLKAGELKKVKPIIQKLITLDSFSSDIHKLKLAKTFFYLGELDSSKVTINELLKLIDHENNPDLLAKCLNILGLIAFNKGEYSLSLHYQKESLKNARISKSINTEADALRQLGVLEWYNGKSDSVVSKYYLPALQLYKQCNDKIGEATVLSNIGLIYNIKDDWLENFKYQIKAFQIRKQIHNQTGLADSYYFLTLNIPHKDKGRTFAYDFYQKSYDLSSRIGYEWGKEIALRCLINVQSDAVNNYNLISAKVDSSYNFSFEGKIHKIWNQAKYFADNGDNLSAAALYKTGITLCDSLNYVSAIESSLIDYSHVLIKLGKYIDAEKIIKRALSITKSEKRNDAYAEVLYSLASLYDNSSKKNLAVKILSELVQFYDSLYISNLNRVYPSLAFESASSSVHYMRSRIYKHYVKTLIELGKIDEAFYTAEKERQLPFWGTRDYEKNGNGLLFNSVEQIIELIEKVDQDILIENKNLQEQIDNIFGSLLLNKEIQFDISSSYKSAGQLTLKGIQSSLFDDEIILEFFIDRETARLFVIKNNYFDLINIKIPIDQLAHITDVHNEMVMINRTADKNNFWKEPSQNLYKYLIAPLREKNLLKGVNHLFISPYQFLHSIPFSCLSYNYDDSTRFLIQDYTITYIPSANYFVSKRTEKKSAINSIAFFAPEINSLPFTLEEFRFINSLPFNKKKIFKEDFATSVNYKNHALNTDIIHIASHGIANRKSPLNSYLVFNDRNLYLHEILSKKLNSKIVLLTACEAGLSVGELGIYPSGHDMVSFPRAFISVGASLVIAPLWIIEDESTLNLIENFYNFLLYSEDEQNRFASALASAQRKFIENASPLKKNPFYWASFFISGYSN